MVLPYPPAPAAQPRRERRTGEDHIVAGSPKNKVQATAAQVRPDRLTAALHGAMAARSGNG